MKLVSPGEAAANSNDIPAEAGEGLPELVAPGIRRLAGQPDDGARTGGRPGELDLELEDEALRALLSDTGDGSTRLYTRRDRARLKLILLGRKVGFSLRDVKQMMDLYDPTGSNTKQLRLALDKSQKQLARLQKQRALIEDAIGELSNSMAVVRQMLTERAAPQASAAG